MYTAKSLTAAMLLAVALPIAAPKCAESAVQAQPLALDLYRVERGTGTDGIEISGTVAARKTANLAAQIPGRISYIAGKEGTRVRAGSELIRIDDTALRAKLDAAVASRNSSLAAIRNANAQLHRELASPQSEASNKAPGGMGVPAMMDQMMTGPMQNFMGMRSDGSERTSDLVGRETQLAQADNAYRQAQAQIQEIQASLRDARTLAPFDGVIETLYVEVGDTLQPGMPLLVLNETGALQVQADVPIRISPQLKLGMTVPVRIDGFGDWIPARISRIFPAADRTQHTVRVEMDLPEQVQTTVGQYAAVRLPAAPIPGAVRDGGDLVIPASAVIRKGGLPLVYAVGGDGLTKLRVVRLGGPAGPQGLVVLSGVREGDLIVSSPPPGLRAGVPVQGGAALQ